MISAVRRAKGRQVAYGKIVLRQLWALNPTKLSRPLIAAYCGLLRLLHIPARRFSCGEQAANADREGPQGRSGRGDSVRVAGVGIRSALRACGRALMAAAQAPSTTLSVWSSQEPGP